MDEAYYDLGRSRARKLSIKNVVFQTADGNKLRDFDNQECDIVTCKKTN